MTWFIIGMLAASGGSNPTVPQFNTGVFIECEEYRTKRAMLLPVNQISYIESEDGRPVVYTINYGATCYALGTYREFKKSLHAYKQEIKK